MESLQNKVSCESNKFSNAEKSELTPLNVYSIEEVGMISRKLTGDAFAKQAKLVNLYREKAIC